jgi:hypothetical protein
MVSRQRGRKSGQQCNNHDPQMRGAIRAANQMLNASSKLLHIPIRIARRDHYGPTVASSGGMFCLPEAVLRCGLVASDVFAVNAIGRPDATKY